MRSSAVLCQQYQHTDHINARSTYESLNAGLCSSVQPCTVNKGRRYITAAIVAKVAVIIITEGLRENLEAISGKLSIDSLQKTAILGTSHIIR